MERRYLERRHRHEERRVGRDWQTWAAAHGFEYREDAPDLIGRWFPRVETGAEAYRYVLSGSMHGVAIIAFIHEAVTGARVKREWYEEFREAYLLARLPRAPSPEVLERGADRTIAEFGIHLRDNYTADFVGVDWLAVHRSGSHDPRRLALHADLAARMIVEAPPELWSRG